MSEIAEDKRKTAPPSSFLHQQTKTIGVAPLRTSHIIKSPPLELNGNGNNTTSSTSSPNNSSNSIAQPPRRVYSVNVSSSNSSSNLDSSSSSSSQSNNSTNGSSNNINQANTSSHSLSIPQTPQPPQISPRQPTQISPRQQQQQQESGNPALVNGVAHSPSLQSSHNTPTTTGALPPKSILKSPPPKLAPRSASSFNLSPNSSSSSLLGGSNNTNTSEADSDNSSFIGDASSFIGDDDPVVDDSDDDTDEEEEEMHDNFLKELGLGGKHDELKEQEKKELEMLAGGHKFRVTRCFVGLGSPVVPAHGSPPSNSRKSIYPGAPVPNQQPQQPPSASANNTQNQNGQTLQNSKRQTVFNPRFSIYRPVAPKKPLPPPPAARKPVARQFTDAQVKGAIKIQRCWRRYQQMLPFKKLKILYRYRWNIVQEIYNTEKTYLKTLEQLSQLFIEPLRRNGLISGDDVKLIFGGIDAIIAINTTLMSDIERILENWTPYSILGKSFTTLGVFLKAYTDYVKNFDFSLRRLEACSKEMKFVAFLKQAEDKTVPRSRLESLLITPVQRIPRYVLLLQDLLKHTEESHPDFTHISEGLEIIKKVAISINDTKRRADNSLKVIEVQNKLVGKFPNLVVADRRYVHEGYLFSGPSNVKAKKVYIFLFNDIIIFSRPSTNKIFSKSKFKFLKIEDLLPSPSITDIPNNPIMTHAFDIELQSVTCTFLSESEESKQIWLNHFKKVFNDINSQQNTNQTLDKRAVEKAGQAKTYIENVFTNIKVKGRVARGGTVRGQAPTDIGDELGQSQEPAVNGDSIGQPPNGNDRYPMMVRQATFHNMTILQREERLKGLAEETSQLKMEHMKTEQQQTFTNNLNNISNSLNQMNNSNNSSSTSSPNESKYGSMKFGTVGKSSFYRKDNSAEDLATSGNNNNNGNHIDGTATLQPEKKRTGAPSLNKIFSTINLTSKDKDKDKEKEKEKDSKKSPPSLSSMNSNSQMKHSTLNLSALNSELKNRQNQQSS